MEPDKTWSMVELADAAAELLYVISATQLGTVCDHLALGITDLDPMSSKRQYVRTLILALRGAEVEAAVSRIVSEFRRAAEAGSFRGSPVSPEWTQAFETLDGYLRHCASPPRRLNLVFASLSKPDIVIADVPSQRISDRSDRALVYDEPIDSDGLTVSALRAWWIARRGDSEKLYPRLQKCIGSNAERVLFEHYYNDFIKALGDQGTRMPALLPQVWLQYDPVTRAERGGLKALAHQRLDFLLFPSADRKIVIEIDGPRHITDESGRPDFAAYQSQLAADRNLTLDGYEVYRFGADELISPKAGATLDDFITRLRLDQS